MNNFSVIRFWGGLRLVAVAMLAMALAGCGERDNVKAHLEARAVPGEPLTVLQVEAQVAGPLAGLHYKWFAVAGTCEPQESNEPKTIFRFSEGVRKDQVSLEIWRDNQLLCQSFIPVKFDESMGSAQQPPPSDVQIVILSVPPAAQCVTNSHEHIDGKVTGNVSPDDLVVIYAWGLNGWQIQPQPHAMHPLHSSNTWASWTHTGMKYAAILVRPGFMPLRRLDMLPQTGGPVLACAMVDGLPGKQTNPAETTNSVPAPSGSAE